MKSSSTKFLLSVFLLTAVCAIAQWVWNCRMPALGLPDGFLLLGIFSISVTVVHLLLLNAAKTPGSGFIRVFMASSVIKFFVYLSVLIGFMLFSKDDKKVLAMHFLFYYFVFNALEITLLYIETRKKQGIQA